MCAFVNRDIFILRKKVNSHNHKHKNILYNISTVLCVEVGRNCNRICNNIMLYTTVGCNINAVCVYSGYTSYSECVRVR